MIETLATALSTTVGPMLQQLLDPTQTDNVLDALGPQGQTFDPLLHNTVNVTIIQGGQKSNVIPSEIVITLDGRLLPGYEPDDMLAELRQLIGDDIEQTYTETVETMDGPWNVEIQPRPKGSGWTLHQEFKRAVVADLPSRCGATLLRTRRTFSPSS